jgi:hypothetical protein
MFLSMKLQRYFISLTTEKYSVEIIYSSTVRTAFLSHITGCGYVRLQFWKVYEFSLEACLKGLLDYSLQSSVDQLIHTWDQ